MRNSETSDLQPVNPTSELRYELKLAIHPQRLASARSWLRLHPEGFHQAHPPRVVNNLYFDTWQMSSFHANLAGDEIRQKLRLRWYGSAAQTHIVNPVLEMKLKRNMLGDKKRQNLTCTLDMTQLYSAILPKIRQASNSEWQHWLQIATQPIMMNHYRREYYESNDQQIRATIDYAQMAYDQRASTRPNMSRPVTMEKFVIIEIKAPPACGDRLQAAMGPFPVSRTRSSKYVNGTLTSGLI